MPEPLLARLLRGWYSGGRSEYEQVAAEDFHRCGKQTFLAALKELARVDLRGSLAKSRCRRWSPAGCATARASARRGRSRAGVPSSELRIVSDAVHLWNLQQPELFNEAVAELLARSSDQTRAAGADEKASDIECGIEVLVEDV
jgi:3-oxoadipate enol-lactonase